jgi:hypothetical protein
MVLFVVKPRILKNNLLLVTDFIYIRLFIFNLINFYFYEDGQIHQNHFNSNSY